MKYNQAPDATRRFIVYQVELQLDSAILPKLQTRRNHLPNKDTTTLSQWFVSPESAFPVVDHPFWKAAEQILDVPIQVEIMHTLHSIGELERVGPLRTHRRVDSKTDNDITNLLEFLLKQSEFSSFSPAHEDIQWAHSLAGRRLLLREVEVAYKLTSNLVPLLQRLYLLGYIDWLSPISFHHGEFGRLQQAYCRRCGYNDQSQSNHRVVELYHRLKTKLWGDEPQLIPMRCQTCRSDSCFFCPRCMQLGLSKSCEPYILWKHTTLFKSFEDKEGQPQLSMKKKVHLAWQEDLSYAQQQASDQLLQFIQECNSKQQQYATTPSSSLGLTGDTEVPHGFPEYIENEFLVYAICGAGKTELIFASLHEALRHGQKILITAPRKDVIIELAPRLKEAFPRTSIVTLHGDSEEKYGQGDLFLATTHQCLRFYHYFDLVIIDEVDAFPFSYDDMLKFAVHRAKKPNGVLVYLTATPSNALQNRAEKGALPHALISTRYHGHPLAVPHIQPIGKWRKWMKSKLVSTELAGFVTHLIQQDRYGYLFVPHVKDLPLVQGYLTAIILPYVQEEKVSSNHPFVIESVYAEHPERSEIVQRFRRHDIHLLLTTTILERGVTISYCDVAVLGSDDPVFQTAGLIQMSGRVGRKIEDPVGNVWFFPEIVTNSQVRCVSMIKKWNRGASHES